MKKELSIMLVAAILLSVTLPPCYAGNAAEKLGRGFANIFTGWLEIPAEIGRKMEKKGELAAIFVSPFTGLCKAIARTCVGVYDMVTFPIPFPRGYAPVIQPEFVLQNS